MHVKKINNLAVFWLINKAPTAALSSLNQKTELCIVCVCVPVIWQSDIMTMTVGSDDLMKRSLQSESF